MIPESKLILDEYTIRKLSLDEPLITKASAIRWIALSLGLVNPNETRTLALDIFSILLVNPEKEWTINELHSKLVDTIGRGASIKSLYYHIEKMKSKGIITKASGKYYLTGKRFFGDKIKEHYLRLLSQILDNVKNVSKKITLSTGD